MIPKQYNESEVPWHCRGISVERIAYETKNLVETMDVCIVFRIDDWDGKSGRKG